MWLRAGWWRMCLLVLYFSPDHLRDPANFAAVANKLICSPVTQVLVFTKVRASGLPRATAKKPSPCNCKHQTVQACAERGTARHCRSRAPPGSG